MMYEAFFDRFLTAQEFAYSLALQEIRAGRKENHWIWFIFPQLQGLGSSPMSARYALPDLDTAKAYAAHPVLGARLREITGALLALEEKDIHRILPWPDDLKVCSCMTLFQLAVPDEPLFQQVLDKYFNGARCEYTLQTICGKLEMETFVKPAFAVIGMEGSTEDGQGFISRLWEQANHRFPEISHLAKTSPDGSPCGIWGVMSDFSRSFRPWEDAFTRGLYLAGVEVRDDAEAPAGWTRWDIPGYEYIRVKNDAPDVFTRTLQNLSNAGMTLVGAVHDFTDPATGQGYMYFPIRKL